MIGQAARTVRKLWSSDDLLALDAFQGLVDQGDLRRFCPSASIRTCKHQVPLHLQGDPCADALCILDGQVTLFRVDPEGNQLTTALLFAGDFLGARDGAEVAEASETARAKGTVQVWRAPAREFQDLLLHHPPFCLRHLQTLSRQQRQSEHRYQAALSMHTEARLAFTLRELSRHFQTRCEHGFGLHLRITQQELADLAGASRPVVSTLLNRLRDRGVLGYNREYICVRDIGVIEHLAGA